MGKLSKAIFIGGFAFFVMPSAFSQSEGIERGKEMFLFGAQVAYSEEGSPPDEEYIDIVLENVRYKMLDPESARFRSIEIRGGSDAKYVCGEVTSKNRFGGYTGFKNFIATPLMMTTYDDYLRENVIAAAYRELCN